MYMDKKKDTSKAQAQVQDNNIGAFFQTCKVNGNYTSKVNCLLDSWVIKTGNSWPISWLVLRWERYGFRKAPLVEKQGRENN